MKGRAFLLYGMTAQSAQDLRESLYRSDIKRVQTFDARAQKVMEARQPLFTDVSGHSFAAIQNLVKLLEARKYTTTIYVCEAPLPRYISEGWVKQQSTYGMLRLKFPKMVVVEDGACALAHARRTLKEEGGSPQVKQPTEVDRLKERQKQQNVQTKERQGQEVLQAKTRELQKKTREDQQKIVNGSKSKAVTK